jgi:hypothetical protein
MKIVFMGNKQEWKGLVLNDSCICRMQIYKVEFVMNEGLLQQLQILVNNAILANCVILTRTIYHGHVRYMMRSRNLIRLGSETFLVAHTL